MAYTIYAWGYGDSLAEALRGVALLFGHDGTFLGLAKVAAIFGFIATLLGYLSAKGQTDPLRIVRFYVVFIGVSTLFFGQTVNVQVHDRSLNQTQIVQRVPFPIAYVLSFMTQIEDAVARTVDSVFGVGVQKCGSQHMSIFGCNQIMAQAMDMRVVDPYIQMSLTNFFQDCVFTNILDGTLNANQLMLSSNLQALVFNNTLLHPSRFTIIYADRPCSSPCTQGCRNGCSLDCRTAGNELRTALSDWVNNQGMSILSSAVGSAAIHDVLNVVPSSVMQVSMTGTQLLMQSVILNQFKETYKNWAASQGMGLTEAGLFTKGQLEKLSAQRYLPVLNGILHVLFASLVPVLVLFMLTPLMGSAIMMVLTMGLWMIIWRFAEGVVNGIFYSKLYNTFLAYSSNGDWSFNAMYAPVISSLLMDHQALAGSLYWLIPTISFMLATLGGYTFHTFAQSVGGAVQAQTASAGADITRGSFTAGQVNYRNVLAGSTQFGNFSGWTTSAMNMTIGQGQIWDKIHRGEVASMAFTAADAHKHMLAGMKNPNNQTAIKALNWLSRMGGGSGFIEYGKDGLITKITFYDGQGGVYHYNKDGTGGAIEANIQGMKTVFTIGEDGRGRLLTGGDTSHFQSFVGTTNSKTWFEQVEHAVSNFLSNDRRLSEETKKQIMNTLSKYRDVLTSTEISDAKKLEYAEAFAREIMGRISYGYQQELARLKKQGASEAEIKQLEANYKAALKDLGGIFMSFAGGSAAGAAMAGAVRGAPAGPAGMLVGGGVGVGAYYVGKFLMHLAERTSLGGGVKKQWEDRKTEEKQQGEKETITAGADFSAATKESESKSKLHTTETSSKITTGTRTSEDVQKSWSIADQKSASETKSISDTSKSGISVSSTDSIGYTANPELAWLQKRFDELGGSPQALRQAVMELQQLRQNPAKYLEEMRAVVGNAPQVDRSKIEKDLKPEGYFEKTQEQVAENMKKLEEQAQGLEKPQDPTQKKRGGKRRKAQ